MAVSTIFVEFHRAQIRASLTGAAGEIQAIAASHLSAVTTRQNAC
jgi:hypothetical protein